MILADTIQPCSAIIQLEVFHSLGVASRCILALILALRRGVSSSCAFTLASILATASLTLFPALSAAFFTAVVTVLDTARPLVVLFFSTFEPWTADFRLPPRFVVFGVSGAGMGAFTGDRERERDRLRGRAGVSGAVTACVGLEIESGDEVG
jgi:hypothetical protein